MRISDIFKEYEAKEKWTLSFELQKKTKSIVLIILSHYLRGAFSENTASYSRTPLISYCHSDLKDKYDETRLISRRIVALSLAVHHVITPASL